jgi:hypothetical protein
MAGRDLVSGRGLAAGPSPVRGAASPQASASGISVQANATASQPLAAMRSMVPTHSCRARSVHTPLTSSLTIIRPATRGHPHGESRRLSRGRPAHADRPCLTWCAGCCRARAPRAPIGGCLLGDHLRDVQAAPDWGPAAQAHLYLWVLEQNSDARAFYAARGGACVERDVPPPGGDPGRLNGKPMCLRYTWPDGSKMLWSSLRAGLPLRSPPLTDRGVQPEVRAAASIGRQLAGQPGRPRR